MCGKLVMMNAKWTCGKFLMNERFLSIHPSFHLSLSLYVFVCACVCVRMCVTLTSITNYLFNCRNPARLTFPQSFINLYNIAQLSTHKEYAVPNCSTKFSIYGSICLLKPHSMTSGIVIDDGCCFTATFVYKVG